MQYILLSAQQVTVLFIVVGVGIVATKTGMINRAGAAMLTDLTLYFATPCVIIKAFFSIRPTPELMGDFGLTALFAAATISLGLLVSYPLFRRESKSRSSILRTATAFSNCGFIGIPLASALLGPESVAYLSIYIVVFNLFIWTIGVRIFQPKAKTSLKAIILNPGIIGLTGGILTLLYRHELPVLLTEPVNFIAGLNTPLAMFVLGFYLSGFAFRIDKDTIPIVLAIAARQILIPLVAIGVSWVLGARGLWLLTSMVACVAPPALNALMFAQKFDGDAKLGATLITYANLISIVTMPLLLGLCFQFF